MNRMKALTVVILVAVLLTLSVGGTVAWLYAESGEVQNIFAPGKVDTELVEAFSNNVKSSISVLNKAEPDSTVPVYVRVSVSGYWCDKNGAIIEPWTGEIALAENSKWFEGRDGFYYYNESIDPGVSTDNLLGTSIAQSVQADGSYLVIDVVHQSIQYAPESAVETEWPVVNATLSEDGESGTLAAK